MKIKLIMVITIVGILLLSVVSCTNVQLSVSIDGQGSVKPDSGSFTAGKTVTLTATPKTGWFFDQWQGSISGDQNPVTVTMDSEKKITARFIQLDYEGSDLSIVFETLPHWMEGTFGSFTLHSTGGSGVKTWRGTPPSPWVLSSSGVLSGTAPMLDAGTTQRTYPPFTVTVIDEGKHARSGMIVLQVVTNGPELAPKQATVTWDKGNPPASGSLFIATASGGVPPYRLSTGGFPPFGMSLVKDADGVSFYLKGPPTADSGTQTFTMSIVDSNNIGASTDITVIITKPVEEVFKGNFSGILGNMSDPVGNQYEDSFSGTITLTIVQNSDYAITGTANVPTDFSVKQIAVAQGYVDSGVTPFNYVANGTVSGTNKGFSGTFSDNARERPLAIVFTGARSGNAITGSMTISRTFGTYWTDASGNKHSTDHPLSVTIPINLTKQP